MDNKYNIGTLINRVGDAVFIQNQINNQPATAIGFLISTINRRNRLQTNRLHNP